MSARSIAAHAPRVATSRRIVTGVAAATVAAGAMMSLSACGSGQISQTADQVSAVNGASGDLGHIALRDVHILYPAVNDQAKIAFVITDQDPIASDTLQSITTAGGGQASISGDTTIKPGKALLGSAPIGTLDSDIDRLKVSLPLTGPLRPGLTTDLTFTFAKSGSVTLPVPIDAGASSGPQEAGSDSGSGS
ncbi:hypothetical protein GCM10023147_05390 [Tsukamurella soli]|uniref:Copper(I)-binding protein n=2 Tax=Tsukamurella soli TaxID=644556 RepID=A0ABP8J439_9ACTN